MDTPETWGAASRGYADSVAPLLMSPYVEEFADRLEPDSSHEALEVAAGSGVLTSVLADRVRSLLATDFAPKMIDVLQERIAAEGKSNVRCMVMDGQALELEDSSFDRAACCFGLMLFPDRGKGFAELARVLRPGGRAMVSGWAGPEKFEGFGLFLAALKRAVPDLPAPSTPPPVFSLADLDRFKTEMEQGGFSGVEVDFVSRELELAGFDALWGMLTVGAPPVQVLFDKIGPANKDRVRDALAAIVRERFGDGPVRVTNVATVGCASVVS